MEDCHSCDYLVVFFCGTLGNNDPEFLGSDESDIVIIVWQLLDLIENQVKTFIIVHLCSRHNDVISKLYCWAREDLPQ